MGWQLGVVVVVRRGLSQKKGFMGRKASNKCICISGAWTVWVFVSFLLIIFTSFSFVLIPLFLSQFFFKLPASLLCSFACFHLVTSPTIQQFLSPFVCLFVYYSLLFSFLLLRFLLFSMVFFFSMCLYISYYLSPLY